MFDPAAPTIEILPGQRSLRIGGEDQAIGARAFDVLAYLHANSGRVVSKAELLENVWADLTVEESNLTVQIAALRKLLGPRAIATVPGVGYQLTLGPTTSPLKPEALPLPDKPSLAVLPFANLTGDPGKDYLVDGIVADLIAALSRIPAFFVISASSTFTLKGQSLDLADVGKQLGVRYILEGSIQQAGDQLRINTQLVEAETGHTIWSDRFAGALADIFDLQDEVTEHVAAAIEPTVLQAEAMRAGAKPTADLRAYELCLRAAPQIFRSYLDSESIAANAKLLERAIELDPGYTQAKALLCRMYLAGYAIRAVSREEARAVLPLAEDILADPRENALALAFAGHTIALLDNQVERGLAALDRAYALNPNSCLVLVHSGWVRCYIGQWETAIDHLERSIRINPLDPNLGRVRNALVNAVMMVRSPEEAIALGELARSTKPEFASLLLHLAVNYWRLGRVNDAERNIKLLQQRIPDLTISGFIQDWPYRDPAYRVLVEQTFRALGVPE